MRLITLVLALLIVGLILYKQLGGESADSTPQISSSENGTPQIPTKPGEVKQFESDINDFVKKQDEERRKRLEEMEQAK